MKGKKIKKLVALCLCSVMVLPLGAVSNAGTYSKTFSFYVDSVGGSKYSSGVTKQDTHGYAHIDIDSVAFNGSSGQLKGRVYNSTKATAATSAYNAHYAGLFAYTYKSGHTDDNYTMKFNAYTTTSCGYGAQMSGTWTPNSY